MRILTDNTPFELGKFFKWRTFFRLEDLLVKRLEEGQKKVKLKTDAINLTGPS